MNTDSELGRRVRKQLAEANLENPYDPEAFGGSSESLVANYFEALLKELGLDMTDESINGTPNRVAKMYRREVFYGLNYNNFPKCMTVPNNMRYEEMVAVKAEVKSMCEHHFMPFFGQAWVGYIPQEKVLGLSKFNRIVSFFSRRPQVQERLTEQVSLVLRMILETEDVAVVIKADHMCVRFRGVEDSCSDTITSKLSGKFRTVPELRAEFLALTR